MFKKRRKNHRRNHLHYMHLLEDGMSVNAVSLKYGVDNKHPKVL